MGRPHGVVNDRYETSVAVGLGIDHGRSAYLEPVNAVPPFGFVVRQVAGPGQLGGAGDDLLGTLTTGCSGTCLTRNASAASKRISTCSLETSRSARRWSTKA